MKVFFDTNVYIAEALLGQGAEQILRATREASWRFFVSDYLLDELERVLVEKLGLSPRFAKLTRARAGRRAKMVVPGKSRHVVPDDAADNPILRAAIASGVDYLVTNDAHLLALDPYEGMRLISMGDFYRLLVDEGMLP